MGSYHLPGLWGLGALSIGLRRLRGALTVCVCVCVCARARECARVSVSRQRAARCCLCESECVMCTVKGGLEGCLTSGALRLTSETLLSSAPVHHIDHRALCQSELTNSSPDGQLYSTSAAINFAKRCVQPLALFTISASTVHSLTREGTPTDEEEAMRCNTGAAHRSRTRDWRDATASSASPAH